MVRWKCACGRVLAVAAESAGNKGTCPACGRVFVIPAPGAALGDAAGGKEPACPSCHQPVAADAVMCVNCGVRLRNAVARTPGMPVESKPTRKRISLLVGAVVLLVLVGVGILVAEQALPATRGDGAVAQSPPISPAVRDVVPDNKVTAPASLESTAPVSSPPPTDPVVEAVHIESAPSEATSSEKKSPSPSSEAAYAGGDALVRGQAADLKPVGYFISPKLAGAKNEGVVVVGPTEPDHTFVVVLADLPVRLFVTSNAGAGAQPAAKALGESSVTKAGARRGAARKYSLDRFTLVLNNGQSCPGRAVNFWNSLVAPVFSFADAAVSSRAPETERLAIAFSVMTGDAVAPFSIQIDGCDPVAVGSARMTPPPLPAPVVVVRGPMPPVLHFGTFVSAPRPTAASSAVTQVTVRPPPAAAPSRQQQIQPSPGRT